MKLLLFIATIASAIVLCSENGQAQDRNQAKQTVSFGVYRVDFQSPESQGWQKTITVAPLVEDTQPIKAISLRSLVPVRSIARNIPLAEVASKLASTKLLVTISD